MTPWSRRYFGERVESVFTREEETFPAPKVVYGTVKDRVSITSVLLSTLLVRDVRFVTE